MNGKTLKVVEYNLTFGDKGRLVDVFGCFRYKKNNRLYVVYADNKSTYNLVYYGSSHVKDKSILCMETNDTRDVEIIKEYIFKMTNRESLDDFEIVSLENIDGLEIINSNRLEVKPEVLSSLVDITIPKPVVEEVVVNTTSKKKKSGLGKLLPILLIVLLVGGGFYYITNLNNNDNTTKFMSCNKNYTDNNVNASVEEELVFRFNHNDILESIETKRTYQFTEDAYLDFINKGLMYQYMPDNSNGGWDKDDNQYTFMIHFIDNIDSSYNKSKDYEGVLLDNKSNGYECKESIKGE